ncbi:MAG: DNA gyrase modulator, partial [Bacilli bacterium]
MNYNLLMKKALASGFSDLEVYEDFSRELTIAIFNGKIDKNEQSEMTTVTIRAIYEGKMAYLQLENTKESPEFILASLRNNALSLTTDEKFSIFEGSDRYPRTKKFPSDLDNYTNAEKIDMLMKIETTIRGIDPRIVMVPYCQYNE